MSKITFYRTEITPERNALVEDLHDYLTEKAIQTFTADNIQYQKIALNLTMTIAADQEKVGDQSLGNYCALEQENRTFYFFIMSTAWVSSKAIDVFLSLDTINTFGQDLVFNPKTTIQRQHMDRLKSYAHESTWGLGNGKKSFYRVIDKQPEGIELPMIRKEASQIRDTKGDFNWYLIYRTRAGLTPDNISNPIECALVADEPLLIHYGHQDLPAQTLTPDLLDRSLYYYFDNVTNPGAYINVSTGGSPEPVRDNEIYVIEVVNDGTADKFKVSILNYDDSKQYQETTVVATQLSKITLIQSEGFKTSSSLFYDYEHIINLSDFVSIETGEKLNVETLPFDRVDKTDSKLMKIIRLPYCPVETTTSSNGETVFPTGWSFKNGYMVLTSGNLNTQFENRITNINLKPFLTLDANVTPKTDRFPSKESKLYSSEFYTFKFNYDSFNKDIPLESFKIAKRYAGEDINVLVDFKPTNTINSKFAFKFDTTANTTADYEFREDYENYLIVNRNNEEPIFSNDYVNYIRNGYNYDQKIKTQNTVFAALGIGSGAAQAGTTLYAGHAADIRQAKLNIATQWENLAPEKRTAGALWDITAKENSLYRAKAISPFLSAAAISAGFGAFNSIISTVQTNIQSGQAIDQKLRQLSQQSSTVAGSDDVDLLQYYNKNRLWKATYVPEELPLQSVFDLFYYTGYSHPVQEIPNTTSRYWFNFIQCDPVFEHEQVSVYSNYLDDIKYRFNQGVTYFHHHPEIDIGWDIDQLYENWETVDYDTSYLPDTKLTVGATQFSSVAGRHLLTWHLIVPVDNVDQYLQFEYRTTNGETKARNTTENNPQSIELRDWDDQLATIRVRRVNRWNDKFSSDWRPII